MKQEQYEINQLNFNAGRNFPVDSLFYKEVLSEIKRQRFDFLDKIENQPLLDRLHSKWHELSFNEKNEITEFFEAYIEIIV